MDCLSHTASLRLSSISSRSGGPQNRPLHWRLLQELRKLPGEPMVPDFVPAYAVVIVLFCLTYFSMASIAFLFVRLDVPEVSRLFRGLFAVYFWLVVCS